MELLITFFKDSHKIRRKNYSTILTNRFKSSKKEFENCSGRTTKKPNSNVWLFLWRNLSLMNQPKIKSQKIKTNG